MQIKCEEVEADLHTTEQALAKLHKLLDDKPIEYVAMALPKELQAYCDIEAGAVKGMFGNRNNSAHRSAFPAPQLPTTKRTIT